MNAWRAWTAGVALMAAATALAAGCSAPGADAGDEAAREVDDGERAPAPTRAAAAVTPAERWEAKQRASAGRALASIEPDASGVRLRAPGALALRLEAGHAGVTLELGAQGPWQPPGAAPGATLKLGAPALTFPGLAGAGGPAAPGAGHGGHDPLRPGAAAGPPRAAGARVERERGTFVEWWRGNARGLEFGLDVPAWPAGAATLEVALALPEGVGCRAAEATARLSGAGVELEAGEALVRDARGVVRAGSVRCADGLRFAFELDGLVAPVVVDPSFWAALPVWRPPTFSNPRVGYALDADGATLVIGAPGYGDEAPDAPATGAVFVYTRSGNGWAREALLLASGGLAGDGLGSAVAVQGDRLVAAAARDATRGPALIVFERSGSAWTERTQLQPAAPQTSLGPVALDGDVVVGGSSAGFTAFHLGGAWAPVFHPVPQLSSIAVGDGVVVAGVAGAAVGTNTSQGVAAAFQLTPGGPVADGTLIGDNGSAGDRFGTAVAVAAGTVLVGAPEQDCVEQDCGAVRTFVREPSAWREQAPLLARTVTRRGRFGGVLTTEGDRVLVGAWDPGAEVLSRSGTTWTSDAVLGVVRTGKPAALGADFAVAGYYDGTAGSEPWQALLGGAWGTVKPFAMPGAVGGQSFGASMAVDGDHALVGAPGLGAPGVIWAYARTGTSWATTGPLSWSGSTVDDRLGSTLALRGELGVSVAGTTAVAYRRAGTTWTEAAALAPNGLQFGDRFGAAVATDGSTIVVGAPGDSAGGTVSQGAVYVFTAAGAGWSQQPTLLPAAAVDGVNFGQDVAVASDWLLVSAPGHPSVDVPGLTVGAVFAFRRSGTTWSAQGSWLGDTGRLDDELAWDGTTLAFRRVDTPARVELWRFGGAWVQEGALPANGLYALQGDWVAVGAALGTVLAQRAGTSWAPVQTLPATSRAALSADTLLLGGASHVAPHALTAPLAQGTACPLGGFTCASGVCADGVCCDRTCGGVCERCDSGTCTAVTLGADPDTCTAAQACDAAGACRAAAGEACGAAVDCASGHCVQGLCCDTACAGGCERCDASPGRCAPVPAGAPGQPACSPYVCDGGQGDCPSACTGDADCTGAAFCAAGGRCEVRRTQGQACDAVQDCAAPGCRLCASGHCVDGVCCDAACDAPCDVCAAALQAPGGADGVCAHAREGFDAGGACGRSVCNGAQRGCPGACARDSHCAPDAFCSAAGSCDLRRVTGARCDPAQDCLDPGCRECASGHCVEGSCCESACDGACGSCAEVPGVCTPAPAGDVGAPSCAPFRCDGASTACPSTCRDDTACSAGAHCAGGGCAADLAAGAACTRDAECATGFCTDGVCCDVPCQGQCEACAEPGTEGLCVAVAGPPRSARTACPGAQGADPCAAAECDGSVRASCAGFVSGVACRAASCDGARGQATLAATCDGRGACPPPVRSDCGAWACRGDACGGAPCATGTDCATDFRCDSTSGECVPSTAAYCAEDGFTLVAADGQRADCSPYLCAEGACRVRCAVSTDCRPGFACDAPTGQCTAAGGRDDGSGAGCGCRLPRSPRDRGRGGALAVALMAVAAARRRVRCTRVVPGAPRPGPRPRTPTRLLAAAVLLTPVLPACSDVAPGPGEGAASAGASGASGASGAEQLPAALAGGHPSLGGLDAAARWERLERLAASRPSGGPLQAEGLGARPTARGARLRAAPTSSRWGAAPASGCGEAVELALDRWGFDGARAATAGSTLDDADGRARRHGALVERWRDVGFGLDQTFEVPEVPAGARRLTIELGVDAGPPTATPDGWGWALCELTLRVGELLVRDARGVVREGRLTPRPAGLVLDFEVGDLVGPLEVDPSYWLAGPEWPAPGFADPEEGAAVDADQVIAVGAPGWGRDQEPWSATGAVAILARAGTGWVREATLVAGDGVAGDRFGQAVSLRGTRLLVGAPARAGGGGVYLFEQAGTSWSERLRLDPPAGAAGFGRAVALGDELALIGAAEAAHAHDALALDLAPLGELRPSVFAPGDDFGAAVATAGARAVVGAPGHDWSGVRSGAAFVFQRSGAGLTEVSALRDPLAAAGDGFGAAVELTDQGVAVGAPDRFPGSATVWRFDTWDEALRLAPQASVAGFGRRLSAAGSELAVSADPTGPLVPGDGITRYTEVHDLALTGATLVRTLALAPAGLSATAAGGPTNASLALYQRSGTGWTPGSLGRLPTARDRAFGTRVAIQGDLAVVGAPGLNSGPVLWGFARSGTVWSREAPIGSAPGLGVSGALSLDGGWLLGAAPLLAPPVPVRAFERAGTGWIERDPLMSPEYCTLSAIAHSGPVALVGAGCASDTPTTQQGAALVFDRTGTTWATSARLLASDREDFAAFGQAVAIAGTTAVVGAPYRTPGGAAYVFERSGTRWTERAVLVADEPGDLFGWSLATDGTRVLVGAPAGDVDPLSPGVAHVFLRTGTTWTREARLAVAGSTTGDRYGQAVAFSGDGAVLGAVDRPTVIFQRAGTGWAELQTLPTRAVGLALSADTLLLGVPSGAKVVPYTLQPALALGQGCPLGDVSCGSGFCRDGVCCASACGGACQRCEPGTGACVTVTLAPDADTCEGQRACDATGVCRGAVGEPCAAAADCASAFCVDGFCCDEGCGGGCDRCDRTPGVCTVVPAGEPGAAPSCGPLLCSGFSPLCPPACATDDDCAPDHFCDAAGACAPARARGAACDAVADCAAPPCRVCGAAPCVDGVCCDGPCDQACDACAAALKASGAADGTCGLAREGVPGAPACGAYACNGLEPTCSATCARDAHCAPDHYCTTAGACAPRRALGAACDPSRECLGGNPACRLCGSSFCVDGVCCASACDGACDRCDAVPGECRPAPAGDPGQPSCAPARCDGAAAACAGGCGADPDCAPGAHCAEGACRFPAAEGATCARDAECEGGHCVDGVCCDATCDGPCEACAEPGLEGSCVPIAGAPRGGRPGCQGAPGGDACAATACDGSERRRCAGFVAGGECRAAACDAATGSAVLAARCNGSGACPPAVSVECGAFACAGAGCGETCAADDGCAAGFRCDLGRGDCVPAEAATCASDGFTLQQPDGATASCRPYVCEGSACRTTCSSSEHCEAGFACDPATGQCVVPARAAPAAEGGCGCRLAPPRDAPAPLLLLAGLLAGAAWRRRLTPSARAA